MPIIDGILETALYVENLGRSCDFYRQVFGFDVIVSSERMCALKVSDRQLLLLFKKRASLGRTPGSHDGDGQLHLAFAISASELAAWEGWLTQHALPIEEKRLWDRGGCSLYFRDPDGHLLEVATPGVWPAVY
jgi:catechol 2,3-dioxygenase-like lactoylglutathione lyase family enzyme